MLQANKRTKACKLCNLASDEVHNFVQCVNVFPRVSTQLLNTNSDSLVCLIDFQNDGFNFVTLSENFPRMINFPRPGDIRNVNHSIKALFQFNESSVACEI